MTKKTAQIFELTLTLIGWILLLWRIFFINSLPFLLFYRLSFLFNLKVIDILVLSIFAISHYISKNKYKRYGYLKFSHIQLSYCIHIIFVSSILIMSFHGRPFPTYFGYILWLVIGLVVGFWITYLVLAKKINKS